jgi:hypothetical protein
MSKTKAEIRTDIEDFIARHGGKYKEWYVGTAADPKKRLFSSHGFKAGDKGLYRQAGSEIQAGELVEYFTDLGTLGNNAVVRDSDFVYAYKRASHTKP